MMIYRVTQAFKKHKVEYAIAGGWAVALHGAVRGTLDLDIVVALTEKNLKVVESALKEIGIESRLPVTASDIIQFRNEYIQNKKMFAWRFMNPSDPTEIVDILIVEDLRKLKTKVITLGGQKISIVAVSDLVRMKKISGRPQDFEDIKALEELKK